PRQRGLLAFGPAAGRSDREHATADHLLGHARAGPLDDADALEAGDERERGARGVRARDRHRIGGVHRGGDHPHAHLVRGEAPRPGDLPHGEHRSQRTRALRDRCSHRLPRPSRSDPGTVRWCRWRVDTARIAAPRCHPSYVAGCGPTRPSAPRSSAAMVSISCALNVKSKTSRFSRIRSGDADFGMETSPSWTCQRRITWAGVLPYSAAIRAISRSDNGSRLCPSGACVSTTIPSRSQASRVSWFWKYGCDSTWSTTGTSPVSSTMRSTCSCSKLGTPAPRSRPSSTRAATARQVDTKSPTYRVGNGQWMRNRSR